MDNLSLKRLSHTRIYKQGTGASRLGKAGGICRGKLTELPKIGGTRAIKVNPSHFKEKQRDLMAVSYPKPKQFAPTTRAAGGQSKAEQIRFLQRGRGNFWVLYGF
ncbi:hypothetical protein SLEP1_g16612 [Rubroshorea leprosula]|uniref:Uncharacterized protein n=1 Tax=Rubroshorea leprosula TaxID=152421 RepID=A0AAV5J0P6_9ROSI|nr:hypothetical protein SLEP1_g16612 [Rubroshorea leprosula]